MGRGRAVDRGFVTFSSESQEDQRRDCDLQEDEERSGQLEHSPYRPREMI